ASGWFAARPSGTESVYKIYAESFKNEVHLDAIVDEARQIVHGALPAADVSSESQGTNMNGRVKRILAHPFPTAYAVSGVLVPVTTLQCPADTGALSPAP